MTVQFRKRTPLQLKNEEMSASFFIISLAFKNVNTVLTKKIKCKKIDNSSLTADPFAHALCGAQSRFSFDFLRLCGAFREILLDLLFKIWYHSIKRALDERKIL